MKSTVRTILLVAASVFAAISCQKEAAVSEPQNSVDTGETIQVNINASLGDLVAADGTKATAESVVRLKWAGTEEAPEYVKAYCGSTEISTGNGLKAIASDNGMFAKLSGAITTTGLTSEASVITFVYSSGCTADGLTFDFSNQTTTNGIPFVAYATLVYDGTATLTDKMVEFKFATSVMKIAATDLGRGEITNVALSGINTKVTLAPVNTETNGSIEPGITGEMDSPAEDITTENFEASSDGTRAIVTVGLVTDNNATARKISFTKEGIDTKKEIAIASDEINEIKESTSYYTPCAFEGADIGFVIIGGRKWATMNLGATTVTEYGKLYSWGNLNGQSGDSFNPQFTNDVYKGTSSGVATEGSKINNIDYIWTKTKHDAAYNELGGSWRMPNKDDFTALANACKGDGYSSGDFSPTETKESIAEVTAKGVYWLNNYDSTDENTGLLFYDGTNKLFFPAAGYGDGTTLYNAGYDGYYWSSSLYTGDTGRAYLLRFYSDGVYPQGSRNRYNGFSVRPVSD